MLLLIAKLNQANIYVYIKAKKIIHQIHNILDVEGMSIFSFAIGAKFSHCFFVSNGEKIPFLQAIYYSNIHLSAPLLFNSLCNLHQLELPWFFL
jgi:hypothetical protein